MPTRRRARYKCSWCKKPFLTQPAMWGHFPQCPVRKLRLQLATQARPEAPPTALADREPRRPGPDSLDNKLCLLETHELIQQLRQDALILASLAAGFARMNIPGEHEKAKEWIAMSQHLENVEWESGQMVALLQLDRTQLFRIYHQMGSLWKTWMQQRTCDLTPAVEGEKETEIWKAIREEGEMWVTVMANIKKMLAAAR